MGDARLLDEQATVPPVLSKQCASLSCSWLTPRAASPQRRATRRICMKYIKYRLPIVHLVLLTLLLCLAQPLARAQNIYNTGFENTTPTNWQGWHAANGVWNIGTPTSGIGPGSAFDGTQC